MGAIGGLLGTAGGAAGTGFSAPTTANISNPVTSDQISGAYNGTQGSLTAQNNLLTALQGQNGLANQTATYNQLQGVANGTGPNPAQAMLNQQTGTNVANQAALMAGQRGASSNVGLMARQAAQQGANTQQQAVGQGATLQSTQQLNALNSMGSMANTMATNQIGQTNANTSAQQAEQSSLLGAQTAYNTAQVQGQTSANTANAALAGTAMQGQQGVVGGVGQAIGASLGLAHGGMVKPKFADGGTVTPYAGQSQFGSFIHSNLQTAADQSASSPDTSSQSQSPSQKLQSGVSSLGQGIMGQLTGGGGGSATGLSAGAGEGGGMELAAAMAAHGGQAQKAVPAMVSPGEKYLSPKAVQAVKKGADPMKVGETIPGKPKVDGAKDSYKNDFVPKTLEEGGVVVPRSKTQSKNPDKASADFVHNILAKRAVKGKK